MKSFLRTARATLTCLALSLICVSPASAATVSLGQTAPAGTAAGCLDCTSFQQSTGTSSPHYVVPPGGGTLTSWSIQGSPSALDCVVQCVARLRVFRPDGSGGYTLTAESAQQTIVPGTLNTFPASIPVAAGDLLGLEGTQIPFAAAGGTDDIFGSVVGVPIVGSLIGGSGLPLTLSPSLILNLSTVLDTGTGDGGGGGGSTTTTTTTTSPPPQAHFAGVRLSGRALRVGRSGLVRIPVNCPAAAHGTCRGSLTLLTVHRFGANATRLKLASARFSVPAGRTRSMLVRISRAGRRALAHRHRLSARLTANARDDSGASKVTSRTLRVSR